MYWLIPDEHIYHFIITLKQYINYTNKRLTKRPNFIRIYTY